MTRLADDFAAIRARRDELARQRDAAQHSDEFAGAPAPSHPEAFLAGHADAEMLHAIFGGAEKAAAHAEAISSDWSNTIAGAAYRCSGIELARRPDGSWSGTIHGRPIDPCPLASALDIARSLRAPRCR